MLQQSSSLLLKLKLMIGVRVAGGLVFHSTSKNPSPFRKGIETWPKNLPRAGAHVSAPHVRLCRDLHNARDPHNRKGWATGTIHHGNIVFQIVAALARSGVWVTVTWVWAGVHWQTGFQVHSDIQSFPEEFSTP